MNATVFVMELGMIYLSNDFFFQKKDKLLDKW